LRRRCAAQVTPVDELEVEAEAEMRGPVDEFEAEVNDAGQRV
jgi:hypothetical protein